MRNLKMLSTILTITAFVQWMPVLVSAGESKTVASPNGQVGVMPIGNPSTQNQREVEHKKEVEFLGPPVPADKPKGSPKDVPGETGVKPLPLERLPMERLPNVPKSALERYIGPPIVILPPTGDYKFPKEFEYGYIKDGQSVTIASTTDTLTIHWEPSLGGDPKVDHAHLNISTTYFLDLKTGKITISSCVEMCTETVLDPKKDQKAYLEALIVMQKKVKDAIASHPILASFVPDPVLKNLIQINNVMAKIIASVHRKIGKVPGIPRDSWKGVPNDPVVW